MSYNTKNYTEQGGEKTVIGGTLEIAEGASVTGLSADPLLVATEETLGGVKAAAAGEDDTVEVKIGEDGKGYVPAYPDYELPAATDEALGGIIAADRTPETDTVEAKIGEDNKLYVPAYPEDYTLPAADSDTLGGVMAAAKGETDTVPAKIGADGILYVPAYPAAYTLPDATAEAIGGVKMAANQADSAEVTSPTVAEFNALLANLKAAGIMVADESET